MTVDLDADTVRVLQARLAQHRPIDPDDETTHDVDPLSTDVDGVLGPATIADLQLFLGRDQTGVLDGDDVRHLQAHLGFTIHGGVLDAPTATALKAALANGTF